MIYKTIRNIKLSALAYGTLNLINPNDVVCVQSAIDNGFNFIDTAESYNDGNSEIIIGTVIKNIRKDVFIATKVSPENLKYDDVIKSCENSLKRLDTDYIDLYFIHWPNNEIPLEDTLRAMDSLLKSGKIRYLGLSNFYLDNIKNVYNVFGNKLLAIQNEYNLIERSAENDVIPFCVDNELFFIGYSPLKYAKYTSYANKFMLSWLISHQNVISIVKSLNRMHIEENSNIGIIKLIDLEKTPTELIPTELVDYKKYEYTPKPEFIAKDIEKYGELKHIKVIKENNRYTVVDGHARFLAWKIAFPNKDIEAIILNR